MYSLEWSGNRCCRQKIPIIALRSESGTLIRLKWNRSTWPSRSSGSESFLFNLLNTTLLFDHAPSLKPFFFWNDNYNPSFWSRSFSQCGTFSIQLFFAITLLFWFSHLFINGKVSIGWWFPKHWKWSTVKLEVAFLVLGACSSSPTEGWEPSEVELDHRTWPCLMKKHASIRSKASRKIQLSNLRKIPNPNPNPPPFRTSTNQWQTPQWHLISNGENPDPNPTFSTIWHRDRKSVV